MTVDSLKASKLGKIVVKLVKDPPTPGELAFLLLGRDYTRQTISVSVIAPVELKTSCHSHCFCTHLTDSVRHVLQYMYLTSLSMFLSFCETQLSRIWLPMWNEGGAIWLAMPKAHRNRLTIIHPKVGHVSSFHWT